MNGQEIKLIALDLDGTTLNSQKRLTDRTRKALEAAIKKGVHVVIATGRSFSALPEDIFTIEGIEYVMTSNGASIVDMRHGGVIYSNYIDAAALEEAVRVLGQYNFMLEIFVDGHAYVDKVVYEKVDGMNFTERHRKYIVETRKPVEGLLNFALAHKDAVENINVNFENQDDRSMMREVLGNLNNMTLTTSFDHNLELGGATTSKAAAILKLCGDLGLTEEEVMACGDSPNDIAMLLTAGLPVAMGNGKEEVKAVAKYITGTNDEDGVAEAIEKFVL